MKRPLILALLIDLALAGAPGFTGAAPPVAAAGAADRCAGFADVTTGDPACVAIATLVANGIIGGYATDPPTFGPADNVQRAQVAAFLVRALDWQGLPTGPRSFTDFGPLVGELRTASLILANRCDDAGACVAQGYGASSCQARGKAFPCFGPNDNVSYAQVISFIARAFQFDPLFVWQPQPNAPLPYSGIPAVHQDDARMYHIYAGTIPSAPSGSGWNAPASRAWVARVLFQALGLSPADPSPSPSPAPPSADQQLVGTAFSLIDSVPDMRYITNTLVARNVQWQFNPALPSSAAGSYNFGTNLISFNTMFRAMDPHDLAAVLGHEGQHAHDLFTAGPPRSSNDCYVLEYRGFVAEALLWYAWYGPNGKLYPVNAFERGENAIMTDVLYNDGRNVIAFILDAYAEQCGGRLTAEIAASSSDAPVATLNGLPAQVGETFPGVAAQLSALAQGGVLLGDVDPNVIQGWTKR